MADKELYEENNLNKDSKHYIVVILLLMLLIFISIGYSYLSTGLKVNGNVGVPKMSWDVHFDNILEDNDNNIIPNIPATINDGKTSIFLIYHWIYLEINMVLM